jgi:ATP-dependent exoDNAse (exonuclease V) alpha subunit
MMNHITNEAVMAAVLRARAKIAEQKAAADKKAGKHLLLNVVVPASKMPPPARQEITAEEAMEMYVPFVPADWRESPMNGHHSETAVKLLEPKEPEITPITFLGKSTPEEIKSTLKNAPMTWHWNAEQAEAIKYGTKRIGEGRSHFCLIGAAGTGKTTTLKGILREGMRMDLYPPLEQGTKHLSVGAPGIVLVSYTRRAVRNIAKQMPPELKSHCLTIHKLIEFGPEYYEADIIDERGVVVGAKTKMRFAPQRHSGDPLPRNLTTIVIDEASMVSMELFEQLLDAIPSKARVQFIVLGDLNQLPPVYGQAILGKMLLENPIIELTQVYRQALESPIIALALAVKNNNFKTFNDQCMDGTFDVQYRTVDKQGVHLRKFDPTKDKVDAKNIIAKDGQLIVKREGRGKVTLHPWKTKMEADDALTAIKGQINHWITTGEYNAEEDIILCPWNESFGTIELNKSIANKLGKMRDADVYEVIAGFNKLYLAVGDKLLVDKSDCIIEKIERNPKYMGKRPAPHSKFLDRWGAYQKAVTTEDDDMGLSDVDIDALLDSMASMEDRTAEASHVLTVRVLDTDEVVPISKAATLNGSTFGYAITVHKAQGSECRKVFFITHYCHSAMLMRELVYTGITRAAEELYIIMSPMMLGTAAARPRIKGDTLAAKLAWYQEKLKEKLA